jgi:4-hydroxybenzoate polyprenyltransferase
MPTLPDLLVTARPRQWIKNLVCLAPLVFSGRLFDPEAILQALVGFLCFCLASSAIYVFNDVRDRLQDQVHPVKRRRPVAAGTLSRKAALTESAILLGAALVAGYFTVPRFRALLALFVLLNLLYSLGLKRIPVLDVMAIALGFVLRVQSGIEAIAAPQSAWIILCTFFMALFIAVGKRRGEIINQGTTAAANRRLVLDAYSLQFLDIMLAISATTTLVCYSIYAVTIQTNETFLLTILPVAFGIARYLMLVIVQREGEGPDEMLTRDIPLAMAAVVWLLLSITVLYLQLHLFPPA